MKMLKMVNHILKCIETISMMSCLPEETLIVEDSPYGLLSRSKSHILRVKNTKKQIIIIFITN